MLYFGKSWKTYNTHANIKMDGYPKNVKIYCKHSNLEPGTYFQIPSPVTFT